MKRRSILSKKGPALMPETFKGKTIGLKAGTIIVWIIFLSIFAIGLWGIFK